MLADDEESTSSRMMKDVTAPGRSDWGPVSSRRISRSDSDTPV